jgi:spermidine synthase
MSGGGDAPDALATRTWLWILLPACAVVLFMGVTNELCLDVASVPFLWILPLSVYLLTFILCFGSERSYNRRLFVWIAVLGVAFFAWVRFGSGDTFGRTGGSWFFTIMILHYSLMLFSFCMMIHGELFRLRPAPQHLTKYYLCISGGGALGGGLVGILAPQLFPGFYELPLGIAISAALMIWLHWRSVKAALHAFPIWKVAVAGAALIALVSWGFLSRDPGPEYARLIHQKRDFFGVIRVYEFDTPKPSMRFRKMMHGSISQGIQYLSTQLRGRPTTYYGTATGLGFVMQEREGNPIKAGIVGLGVGTIAAYGVKGDHFQFYEINSDVIQMSESPGLFTYLSDSAATIEVIPGDARLSLETQLREGGPQGFDVFVMDAFSSDAIPVHLITREAFELYSQHLKPNGTLAIHITNNYVDLTGVMFRIADGLGMHAVEIQNASYSGNLHTAANWVILSRDKARIEAFRGIVKQRRARANVTDEELNATYSDTVDWRHAPLWTDDYSDLFSALKDF